jgi:hypothetical protein
MIPYDDLVVALTAWRARQGLPVAQPVAAASSAPARGHAAPPAPVRSAAAPARPAVPQAPPDVGDFEDGSLVEDASYDAGDDYVMQLGGDEHPVEETEIGSVPEPAPAPRRGKRPDSW